jgi:hypothetical protein
MPLKPDSREVYLDVPRLDQHAIFPHASHKDNMACWYTSAFMVLLHRIGIGLVANVNAVSNINTLVRY